MAAKRAAIIELYKNGTRVNEIARLVNIHHQNVTRTISRYKELGTLEDRPRTGRPPVQRVQKAKVLIEAKISRIPKRSQRKLAKQHGISRATVTNMVKEELGSYPYKLRKAIALTDEEKRKRLERCEALLKRFAKNNHRKILFSDESYFQLEEGFNRQNTRIIAVSREEANAAGRLVPKSQFPKTLMVWGGICWNGKTPLVIFNPDEKVRTDNYKSKVLLPLKDRWAPALFKNGNWTFQQDSAPAHKSISNQEWCRQNFPDFITREQWPPSFPEGNPMDYCIWPILKSKVSTTSHRGVDRWKRVLRKAWDEIPLDTIRKSINQVPKRLKACIDAKGGYVENK